MKVLGHIDADCFYVSCERVRDPRLINKPVGVLSNQGACVIARSYEIRPHGVKVGMPIWDAKKLSPDAIYIKRDFQWYGVLSSAMQKVLKQFSDTVEYYSIDESFVDFGEFKGDWQKLALDIQDQMLKQVGMPTSVGISLSKTLAKIASDHNKPFGTTIVKPDDLENFVGSVHVSEIPGIGRKLFSRLEGIGVKTCADYVNQDQFNIKRLLHKPGEEIWYELQGKAILPVRSIRPERKNLSRGGSLWGHHKDPKYIWCFILRNLERLADSLWSHEMETLTLLIILVSSDGYVFKSVQTLPDYTSSYGLLLDAVKKGFIKIFHQGQVYCQSHLIAENLRPIKGKQLNMFEVDDEKQRKLVKVKKLLNDKFGIFTARSASTQYAPSVFKDEASYYEISDVEGKFCF